MQSGAAPTPPPTRPPPPLPPSSPPPPPLLKGHTAAVVALDGDAEKVVSGARDGTVRVWDLAAGELRFMLQGFTAYIGSVQISPSWLIADGTNNNVVCMDFSGEGGEAEGDE